MTTKDYQKKHPLIIFLNFFKRHKGLFALDMGCAIAMAIIDLAFPMVTRTALYDMLPNAMYRTFFIVMVIVVGFYLLRAALNYVVAYWGHRFGNRVETDVRAELFRHLQELSFDFYDHKISVTFGRTERTA